MQKKNKRTSNLIFNSVLIALVAVSTLTASVMAGCSDNSESAETGATKVITETEIVTDVIPMTEYVTVTDDDGNVIGTEVVEVTNSSDSDSGSSVSDNSSSSGSQVSANSVSSANSKSSDSSTASGSSKSSNSSSSSSSSKNSDSSSSSNTSSSDNNNSASDVLSIDGNKFHVGDTVTCKLNITTPTKIENFQGTIKYDDKYLELTYAKLVSPASGGGMINPNVDGIVKFNGSSGSTGYDYTSGGTLLEITFEVKAAGSTTPTVDWVIVRQLQQNGKGTNYISNGKPSGGMKASFSYS